MRWRKSSKFDLGKLGLGMSFVQTHDKEETRWRWMTLMWKLGNTPDGPTKMLDQSAIATAVEIQQIDRAHEIIVQKHLWICKIWKFEASMNLLESQTHQHYFFSGKQVSNRTIEPDYCPTQEMIADMLTKEFVQQQLCFLEKRQDWDLWRTARLESESWVRKSVKNILITGLEYVCMYVYVSY